MTIPVRFTAETLRSYVPLPGGMDRALFTASCHALETEGEFARANLVKGLGVALGLDERISEKLAASIELFHLASLILDDMPCMDDADVRRSRPCVHKLFGDGTAVLTALGFINRAYWILWKLYSEFDLSIQQDAAGLVESCLGFDGLLDGQSKDIHFVNTNDDTARVLEIASKKTGSLLRLCLVLPAILAESSRYEKMHLDRLAENWGLAYQIADDLKDVFYGEGTSGKTAQRDAQLGRPNLALAAGESTTVAILKRLISDSESSVRAVADEQESDFFALRLFQDRLSVKAEALIAAYVAA
ncbi:MAG: hypothetical protein HN457_00105 [Opitutales bacterium]|jgi:geranylgeranyl diphosphate synthase, type II|nr:hypothetical protein [Opitutales bacterium]